MTSSWQKGVRPQESARHGRCRRLYSGWTTGSWAAGPMVSADEPAGSTVLNLGIRAMTYIRDPGPSRKPRERNRPL